MIAPLLNDLQSALNIPLESRVSILREPSVGIVIPDVLVGLWSSQPAFWLPSGVSHLQAHVVAVLEQHGRSSVEQISKQLWLPTDRVKEIIHLFQKQKVVTVNDDGTYSLRVGNTAEAEIIAIEAKMVRWRDALRQAVSYKRFANLSYVVLDAGQTQLRPEIITEFEQVGVGLMLQTNTYLRVCIPALRAFPVSSDRVAAYLKLRDAGVKPTDQLRYATGGMR